MSVTNFRQLPDIELTSEERFNFVERFRQGELIFHHQQKPPHIVRLRLNQKWVSAGRNEIIDVIQYPIISPGTGLLVGVDDYVGRRVKDDFLAFVREISMWAPDQDQQWFLNQEELTSLLSTNFLPG